MQPHNQPMSFDVGDAPTPDQWVSFRLQGHRADGTAWAEDFVAVPEPSAVALQHLMSAPKIDPGTGAVGYLLPDVARYLEMVLANDQERSRFQRLLGDPTRHITLGGLVKVMQWHAELAGGFPTGAPTASARGASSTGPSFVEQPSQTGYPTPGPYSPPTGDRSSQGFDGRVLPRQPGGRSGG